VRGRTPAAQRPVDARQAAPEPEHHDEHREGQAYYPVTPNLTQASTLLSS